MSVRRVGPIDDTNQFILHNYAQQIKNDHIDKLYSIASKPVAKEGKSAWEKAKEWLPSPWTVGSNVGYVVGQTHGQEMTNGAIEWIFSSLFADPANAPPPGWKDRFISWFKKDIAQPSVIEAAKLTITPAVLPYVSVGLSVAGGITATAAVMAAQYLIAKAVGKRPEDLTIKDIESAKKLIHIEKGQIFIGNTPISEEGMKDVLSYFNRYSLAQELQSLKKEEVADFFMNRLMIVPQGDKIMMADGYILTAEEEEALAETIRLLSVDNPACKRTVEKVIDLFASHTKEISSDAFENEIVQSGDNYYRMPNRENGERYAKPISREEIAAHRREQHEFEAKLSEEARKKKIADDEAFLEKELQEFAQVVISEDSPV